MSKDSTQRFRDLMFGHSEIKSIDKETFLVNKETLVSMVSGSLSEREFDKKSQQLTELSKKYDRVKYIEICTVEDNGNISLRIIYI